MKMGFYFFLFFLSMGHSQNSIIPLWGQDIPNSQNSDELEDVEETNITRIGKVQTPTLEVFLPAKQSRNGKAVIICPGGGYRILSYDWEGTDVAKWFNSQGIVAFVLKSRLPQSKSIKIQEIAPLQDAQQAIRLVRSRAKD